MGLLENTKRYQTNKKLIENLTLSSLQEIAYDNGSASMKIYISGAPFTLRIQFESSSIFFLVSLFWPVIFAKMISLLLKVQIVIEQIESFFWKNFPEIPRKFAYKG